MKSKLFASLALSAIVILSGRVLASDSNPPTQPAPAMPTPKELADLENKNKALEGQVQQQQQQLNQQQVVAEYYKAVAEKNAALLQVNALQVDLLAAQKARDEALAKVHELEATIAVDKARTAVEKKTK